MFALGIIAIQQDAFGILGCDNPHCYALQQTSRATAIQGIEYSLDSPDLYVDRTACNNIAVSAGWLHAISTGEWIEAGVTKGHLTNLDGTSSCITQLSTYYAYATVYDGMRMYKEYLVPNGRVDPGDDITVKLQKHGANQVQAYVTTPDRTSQFPVAQLNMNPNNVYYGDYGIEGTISATDEYSSIPMSKFTNMKTKQGTSWVNLPSSATVYTPSTGEGYLGQECTGNAFVAGSVTALDCNVVATRNQAPTTYDMIFNPTTNSPITITLNATDTDNDYLTYYINELPTNGFSSHVNKAQKIPSTSGDTATIVYTPADTVPESDTIRYTATDKRSGHSREGLISIMGQNVTTVPSAIDDFAFTLDGNIIKFTWGIPNDGGSDITSFKIERSRDTENWSLHKTVSETTTSLDYTRSPGYDHYFRMFAKNSLGFSPSSNVLHVHINDNTPPTIRISSPANNEIITTQKIDVSGSVLEPQNTGVEYVDVYVNDTVSSDPVTVKPLSNTLTKFNSKLTDLANANYTIKVKTENGDGLSASKSVNVTLDAPIPTTLHSLSVDFEEDSDLARWELSTEDDEYWSIRNSPIEPVPNSETGNKVVGTEDCDNICSMVMIDKVDLTNMTKPTLSFYRFVATGADVSNSEGIYVYTSEDGGDVWSLLANFTANNSDDDGLWHLEKFNLTNTSDSFKLRFDARSSSNSEDTELDDVLIYDDVEADTIPPTITAPPDKTFEATATFTPLNSTALGIANATDNADNSPTITNNSTGLFPLGNTIILYNATDSAGNSANDTQTITIQDTTPPALFIPDDKVFEATALERPCQMVLLALILQTPLT